MELPDKLQTVTLDVKKGELVVNGEQLHDVSDFSLEFCNGNWKMSLQMRKFYSVVGKAASKDTAKE